MSTDNRNIFNVLGTAIGALNLESAKALIIQWLSADGIRRTACVTGVHGVMESLRNVEIKRAHNQADLCVPDGMPLVWLGKLHGHKEIGRVYGPDLMLKILELSALKGFTNYFYGGKEGVAEDLKDKMQKRFPGLKVSGTYCPPFRELNETEEKEILEQINKCQPDFLWIGLSTPKQELLMARWKEKGIKAKVMIGVGAAFDFHTGRIKQAPDWIQNIGMEWFFRLCMEPRRLAPRYLENIPAFLFHIILQLTKLRKYPTV
jgi:N-acetylglucosaminyldiphosphoundecaprenol N-acetyl-beta-D-mannosaminyltransferase